MLLSTSKKTDRRTLQKNLATEYKKSSVSVSTSVPALVPPLQQLLEHTNFGNKESKSK
jgi:hypothetical protein